MPNYDLTQGSGNFPFQDMSKHFAVEATLDCSKQNMVASDVAEMLNIPAQTLVSRVYWQVLTAEGATLTFDVGDGAGATGFLSGKNGNSVANGISALALTAGSPNTVTGYTGGKYYDTADTLDITVHNTCTKAKIRIVAVCVDLS